MTDHWQLPTGVSPGTQEYFESDEIASDYDSYFEYTSLFSFDESIVINELGKGDDKSIVADFGCGTGRALVATGKQGHRGLAIDMSTKMLQIVQRKAIENNLHIDCVKANLVDLDGFRDSSIDHGVCLFSTLGMIQGNSNRQSAMTHFRRMLKPGGKLILHVHNYWYNLYDPGGPKWMARNAWQSLRSKEIERGDRTYPYRGVYNMFLHVFTRGEIRRLLRRAGFASLRFIPLSPVRMTALSHAWFLSNFRCNGWVVICQ